MKNRLFDRIFTHSIGTVFLLAGAFFVCSTIWSMRAVLADPLAGYGMTGTVAATSPQATRAGTQSTARGNTTTTANRSGASVTAVRGNAPSASVSGRSIASRTGAVVQNSRGVVSRGVGNATIARPGRAVTSRVGVSQPNVSSASRVSLSGNAIRASTGTTYSNNLYNRLYTGTYATIVDPTTGLISADAYANCAESYYACMDEICTARNPGQRRCACAGRVKTFANVEAQLQTAKEDLLNVSGQLSLLIASKGKADTIASAFQLTDAEKVLNCVSYRDAAKAGTLAEWCENHTMVIGTTACSGSVAAPKYCSDNTYGWGSGSTWMDTLNGADSDILAGLQTYASTIDKINVITTDDNDSLINSFLNVSNIVSQLGGTGNIFDTTATAPDTLANTWGYDLFQYAHNNVCSRVLDSCFNGIYEACGSHNGTTGPYNYNSTITINNNGTDLNFIQPSSTNTTSSATCYGYTATSGDPYSTLRRPVSDARRSVMQKYVLDANADCDAYGEELRTQATNMAYQKIAATQLLQKKRLEFIEDEKTATITASVEGKANFSECLSELYDCYETQVSSNSTWSTSRIKNYCSMVANVPSCYEQMVCSPTGAAVSAVIELDDDANCNYTADYATNTCRNVVTLYEILNKASATAIQATVGMKGSSAAFREQCLQDAGVKAIRDWKRGSDTEGNY